MAELITLLFIVTVSMLVVRVGAIALEKTGLSPDTAIFQAQSAFMGVGFTTLEAESVVNHPLRRRIIRILMLLGFAAVTSTLGTLVLTFAVEQGGLSRAVKLLMALGGVVLLWIGARIRSLDRLLDLVIGRALEAMPTLRVVDYRGLLNLDKGYTVATLAVEEGSWLADKTLRELGLAEEGILVLHIARAHGPVIATPASRTRLHPGDTLLAYGLEDGIAHLRDRPREREAAEAAHREAVDRQRLRIAEERVEDAIAEREEGRAKEPGPENAAAKAEDKAEERKTDA